MLGRNSQNKPNGFSIHVVLRSGAEINNLSVFWGEGRLGIRLRCARGSWEGKKELLSCTVVLISYLVNMSSDVM